MDDEDQDFARLGEIDYRRLAAEFGVLERKEAPSLSPHRLAERYEARVADGRRLLGIGRDRGAPWTPFDVA